MQKYNKIFYVLMLLTVFFAGIFEAANDQWYWAIAGFTIMIFLGAVGIYNLKKNS